MPQIALPTNKSVLAALLRADFITQWRNRRSMILILLIPVIILLSWAPLVPVFGGAFVLSNSITIGLTAIGLMGYSNSIARDRDKGIFQRLRVAPLQPWSIMASRLAVQLAMILSLTATVFIAGARFAQIVLPVNGYLLGFVMAFMGGTVYLGLGQAIVGLIKNVETVNAVTRLVYFVFIMVGMFAEMGKLGESMGNIVRWSPYGTVKNLLATAMEPGNWNRQTTEELLVTVGYAVFFSGLGIRWFRWSPAR
jgi:ABC-2 type transport system permease protein